MNITPNNKVYLHNSGYLSDWITPICDNSLHQAELPSGLTDEFRAKYKNCSGSEPEVISFLFVVTALNPLNAGFLYLC